MCRGKASLMTFHISNSNELQSIADKCGARRQSAHRPSPHRHHRLRRECLPRRRTPENRARPHLHVRFVRIPIYTPSGKAAAEINELFEWIQGAVSLG